MLHPYRACASAHHYASLFMPRSAALSTFVRNNFVSSITWSGLFIVSHLHLAESTNHDWFMEIVESLSKCDCKSLMKNGEKLIYHLPTAALDNSRSDLETMLQVSSVFSCSRNWIFHTESRGRPGRHRPHTACRCVFITAIVHHVYSSVVAACFHQR